MTYKLDPQLQDLSSMKGGHLRKLPLLWNSFCMRNTYRCLNKVSGIKVNKVKVDGFYVYVISPDNLEKGKHPAILDYHGGAFSYRGWDNHFYCAAEYAIRTKSIVFYVDYRLAYQRKYQLPLNDCIYAYQWVLEHKEYYSLDIDKIFLMGDSAGGYLALKVREYIQMQNLTKPKGVLLLYPVVDPSQRCESIRKFPDTPVWDSNSNREMWNMYLKGHQEESFLDKDLSYLNHVYLELCEFDCLHDEGKELYQKIHDNTDVVLNETKGTCHGYDIYLDRKIVQDAITRRCDFILALK